MVVVAQLVEPRIVIPVVVGSSPIDHPIFLVDLTGCSCLKRQLNNNCSVVIITYALHGSVELDTPNAVFTIDHAGYYRVDVDGEVHLNLNPAIKSKLPLIATATLGVSAS